MRRGERERESKIEKRLKMSRDFFYTLKLLSWPTTMTDTWFEGVGGVGGGACPLVSSRLEGGAEGWGVDTTTGSITVTSKMD